MAGAGDSPPHTVPTGLWLSEPGALPFLRHQQGDRSCAQGRRDHGCTGVRLQCIPGAKPTIPEHPAPLPPKAGKGEGGLLLYHSFGEIRFVQKDPFLVEVKAVTLKAE